MSSKVSSKKLKQPLNLPLGKGSCQKELDLSHIRLPIETSIFGLKQVLNLFETATNEVKSYLAYECNLIYECRACRTIFRSLANFILHKRKYCRDKFNSLDSSNQCCENNGISVIQSDIIEANKIVEEDDETKINVSSKHLDPIIEKLLKKHKHKEFVEQIKNKNLSNINEDEVEPPDSIILEPMNHSKVAVFQTLTSKSNLGESEFMKSEVMEIHSILEDSEGVLGPDGKLISSNNNKQEKLFLSCTECKKKFSTKKTLSYHVKFEHNDSRLVYPCPLCKEFLSNPYGVYRHLLKVHRKTSAQIRKYRNQVHNSAICRRKDELQSRMKKDSKENLKEAKEDNDKDNEWLDNVEGDNDLQMCGGCGKRFERKAALTSHSVMCTKRIAICNSIKENNAKKKESDDRENRLRIRTSKQFSVQNNGSARRKPENLITYKSKFKESKTEPDLQCNEIISNLNDDDLVRVELCTQVTEMTSSSENETSGNETTSSSDNVKKGNDTTSIPEEKDEDDSTINKDNKDLCESPLSQKSDNSSKLSEGSHSPFRGFESSCSKNLSRVTEIFPVNEPSENINEVEYETCENAINENCEIESDQPCAAEEVPMIVHKTLRSRCITIGHTPNGNIFISEESNQSDNNINCDEETRDDNSHTSPIDLMPKVDSIGDNYVIDTDSGDGEANPLFVKNSYPDPNFSDFKSVIKDIYDERYQQLNDECFEAVVTEEKCTDSEKLVIINEDSLENTNTFSTLKGKESTSYDSVSETIDINPNQLADSEQLENNESITNGSIKRQCSMSPSDNLKKRKVACESRDNDELQTESEDEVFISKITPYTDLNNSFCSLCNTEFNSLSALLLHMSLHFSWYRYQCSKCSFMSYKKHDCESHVHKEHQLPFSKIQNIVLPLPTWKSTLLSNGVGTSNSISDISARVKMREEEENVPEDNDDMKREHSREENIVGFIDLTSEIDDDEECILREDQITEEQDLHEEKPVVEINNSPDISSHSLLESNLKTINKTLGVEHARPPRNRVKSVRTSQKDFIYDLDVVRVKAPKSVPKTIEDSNDLKTK